MMDSDKSTYDALRLAYFRLNQVRSDLTDPRSVELPHDSQPSRFAPTPHPEHWEPPIALVKDRIANTLAGIEAALREAGN